MFAALKNFWRRRRMNRRIPGNSWFSVRRRQPENPLLEAAKDSRGPALIIALILWIFSALVLTFPPKVASTFNFVVGQQVEQPIYAECDFRYPDYSAMAERRQRMHNDRPVYLTLNEELSAAAVKRFDEFLRLVRSRITADNERQNWTVPDTEEGALASGLSETELQFIGRLIGSEQLLNKFYNSLQLILASGIIDPALNSSPDIPWQEVRIVDSAGRRRIAQSAGTLPTPSAAANKLTDELFNLQMTGNEERDVLRPGLTKAIRQLLGNHGNLSLNNDLNQSIANEEEQKQAVIYKTVDKAGIILQRGSKVTGHDLEILKLYQDELAKQQLNSQWPVKLVHKLTFCLFLLLFSGLCHYYFLSDSYSNYDICFIASITILVLGVNYLYAQSFMYMAERFGFQPDIFFRMAPVVLVAALLTVTKGIHMALGSIFFITAIMTEMHHLPFRDVLLALLIGTLAAAVVRNVTNYRSFFIRILLLSLLYCMLDGTFFEHLFRHSERVPLVGVMLAGALTTAIIALLLVFIIELIFNESTNMSLMVLCDFNHTLLKQLQLNAPGTSLHCQNVAILAEVAATRIGANPQKARAAALYHDIGKLSNPGYFTENNIAESNRHIGLTPRMSSIVIQNHVKDGLELARRYKLPRLVRDAIKQHHGTDLLMHFYNLASKQAAEAEQPEAVLEKDYRYTGPLPSKPEIVIVSLADACEAACRSLEKPTASRVSAMVDDIFRIRLDSGQLNHAELTVAQLALIKESFIRTLTTMYHGRVPYLRSNK